MHGAEAIETFPCFGGRVSVIVMGDGPAGTPAAAAALARARLLEWHDQFSRFEAASELSRLNADPRQTVAVSAVMARLVAAILGAARESGGLVDATLVGELEHAGYAGHFDGEPVDLPLAPARPNPASRWGSVRVNPAARTVTRPPGLRFDSGGLAKGLFGDILAGILGMHASFAIDCAGDVRLGGSSGLARPVQIASPFDESLLHVFEVVDGAAATSGIGRRSWLDGAGRPAHHLLDPSSGHPAFTGLVQVTALAPTGVEAEVLAKTALLRGPAGAGATLRHGGAAVHDSGRLEVIAPGSSM